MKVLGRSVSSQDLASDALRFRELGIGIALALTVLLFSVRATNFATVSNWQDIASDVAMARMLPFGFGS